MTGIDFNKIRKVHFIGIGGISMSAIASVLLSRGYKVTGSDSKSGTLLDELKALGAEIFIGHRAVNVAPDTDLVIYTAAIPPDNPELVISRQSGFPVITRAELLGQLMKSYPDAVCISGTHGKTTTTSLISKIFVDADADPTIMVGGLVPFLNGNLRIGKGDIFITEACEYTNSFLSFFPTIEVILNIKADHLDFFKDLDDIRQSFRTYASLLPEDGTLIINGEIDNLNYITDGLSASVKTFGLKKEFDYSADNIQFDECACPEFDIYKKGIKSGHIRLSICGMHNVFNCLAALAVADELNLDWETSLSSAAGFNGVERRFEIKGNIGGITIIDDYAHHPDEIEATLKTALSLPHKKLWCVFQPHTYTRTKLLLDEFAKALSLSDAVILADIYAAREKNTIGISSADLMAKIADRNTECHYFPTFDEIENFILENLSAGDLLITMGAGDIVIVGNRLLGK